MESNRDYLIFVWATIVMLYELQLTKQNPSGVEHGPNVGFLVGLEVKPSLTLIISLISLSKFLGDHTQPLPYLLFTLDTGLKGCSLSTWNHPSFHVNLWNVPLIR